MNNQGYTLIELVLIILLIGVISSVAVRQMTSSVQTAQYEHTKQELDQLAYAIVGDPHVFANGSRSDFGYVGDVGALPTNLDALVTNPGYATWDGPYMTNGTGNNDFKNDSWNSNYILTGTSIRSTGSGSNIDKELAPSVNALLANTVSGYIIDASGQAPGSVYADSMLVRLIYPNGSGGYTTAAISPSKSGSFSFTSLPIGVHSLEVIYHPDTDTVRYSVAVLPESATKLSLVFPADLF